LDIDSVNIEQYQNTFCIVTCLFPALDATRDDNEWLELFAPLVSSKIPIIIYTTPEIEIELLSMLINGQLTVRPLTYFGLFEGLWLYEEVMTAASERSILDLDVLRNVLSVRSLGWIHDESIFNLFRCDRFLWVHQSLIQEISCCYLSDRTLLQSFNILLNRFLLLYKTEPDGIARFSDRIFGANRKNLSKINSYYWGAYKKAVSSGLIPNFDMVISDVFVERPELFDRFRLQSNGLEGFLFEGIRQDSVAIEETYYPNMVL
jgi:hypothetical protein